jgi:hypothetical protein
MTDEATTLADSSVNDMVVLMKDADLATLQRALEIENAKTLPRKGAVAALQSAIDGHPELSADAAAAADAEATHDTEHDHGLTQTDARVRGDAVPVVAATAILQDEKQPLGSLPDTATATATVAEPLTINTDVSVRADAEPAPALGDAIIPTKPGGADVDDVLDDNTKDVVSKAPARANEGLVNQLDLKWSELKHFVSTVTGDVDGELGDVLAFVRAHL